MPTYRFIVGMKSEVNVEMVGYTAKGLPTLDGVEPQNGGEVEIAIDANGKPAVDKASGLSLSFTQATGVFKGKYAFVYDAKTKKYVQFEGVLVQGDEPRMDGFFLWDGAGTYADPKTGKIKSYRYKTSFGVGLAPQL